MSRIGKLPILVPEGVMVTIKDPSLSTKGQTVIVKGKKGELTFSVHPNIQVLVKNNTITVSKKRNKEDNALHGTTRAIINNMIIGVTKGYEKRLEIRGVGYRFTVAGKKITFSIGFSHPVEFTLPQSITMATDEENKNLMIIQGPDKQVVGETAARIRGLRPPEPYKGKGIRYAGEQIILKQGKKAAK